MVDQYDERRVQTEAGQGPSSLRDGHGYEYGRHQQGARGRTGGRGADMYRQSGNNPGQSRDNFRSRNSEWTSRPDGRFRESAAGQDGSRRLRNGRNSQENSSGRGRVTWRERNQPNSPPHLVKDLGRLSVSEDIQTRVQFEVKENIPQLVQDLHDKLRKGEVECMICYEMVGRSAPIWSCCGCYSIFHLTCIRKWARAPTSVDRSANAGGGFDGSWRCPGCQAPQHIPANDLRYWCFCGQQVEPSVDFYISPHSCGGPCRKPLDKSKDGQCKHLCTLQCHPGPCPPCVAFAAPETCGCGRTTVTRRCVGKDGSIISCGHPCERTLSCGRHRCTRFCHEDDCGSCGTMVAVRCFCQRKQEGMPCGQIPVEGELKKDAGVFSCGTPCSKLLPCGRHSCTEECHPGSCGECELSPSKVISCSCGKRTLRELSGNGKIRKSCVDPIPTCGQVCEKLLQCKKHKCERLCHVGPCPPCEVLVEQDCRCGGSSRVVACHATSAGNLQDQHAFICDRKCGGKKNCGRHRCTNKCCPSQEVDRDTHFCMLLCGKKLRCGQHVCQELCHPGHCPPCLESAFADLSCACGKSSIPPPVPCGTPRPHCDYPCSIPQPCGHPATHTCHFGECPPCSVPVAKECVGNHMIMRNVPCGSKEIKCNKPCGKIRRCGIHACARTCHPDSCESEQDSRSLSCGQVCGAPRRDCSHSCIAPCHPSLSCPDVRCSSVVNITCACGRLSAKVPCDVGGGARQLLLEAKNMGTLPAPLQPVQSSERVPFSQRKLACDDECAKEEKLRALAEALGIGAPGPGGDGVSEASQEMLKKDPQFVADVENRFKYLLLGPKAIAGLGGIRVHAFCALSKDRREVIHQLAHKWNLSVNSVGWDPKRYMVVHANAKSRMPTRLTKPGLSAPSFNPSLDFDPRLVVALFDLPRDADISSLVLRFGGECELVWLNDRNALALFGDAARAATALRRVDHASSYHGAIVTVPPKQHAAWGATSAALPSLKNAAHRNGLNPSWVEDAWDEDVNSPGGASWLEKKAAVTVSNPWKPLEQPGSAGAGESSSKLPINGNTLTSDGATVEDWESAFE